MWRAVPGHRLCIVRQPNQVGHASTTTIAAMREKCLRLAERATSAPMNPIDPCPLERDQSRQVQITVPSIALCRHESLTQKFVQLNECCPDLWTDLERSRADRGPEPGAQTSRRGRQVRDRCRNDARRQSAPSGVDRRDTSSVIVRDQDRQAVGTHDHAGQIGLICPAGIGLWFLVRLRSDDASTMNLPQPGRFARQSRCLDHQIAIAADIFQGIAHVRAQIQGIQWRSADTPASRGRDRVYARVARPIRKDQAGRFPALPGFSGDAAHARDLRRDGSPPPEACAEADASRQNPPASTLRGSVRLADAYR